MRLHRTLKIAGAALVLTSGIARAQAIRGVVVDAGDRPVSGVVVLLLDSASKVVSRALSNESGDFRVAASSSGPYRLRTMRIGFRPTMSDPIPLVLGNEITKRVSLTGTALALDTVRVVDKNSCRVASDQTVAATFAVLEQARTALTAAQLTLAGHAINATTTAYDRLLEADGKRVTKQSSRTTTAYVAQPWRAITPDSAHRAGFVFVDRDNSTTYFAPSIDILVANTFIEDHCFRMVTDRRQPSLVGVAFEPSPERRKVSEIKGTLWVDRKTAALQRLEYRYVNIAPEQQDAGAGGEMSFAALSNGGWAITRWDIRMPVLEQVLRSEMLGGNLTRVAAIQVAGGEILFATRAHDAVVDTLWSRPGPTLYGVVIDSARGAPVAHAHVDLVGVNGGSTTDDRGRFVIANVLPGTYQVETVTPDLAAIGAANESMLTFADTSASYEIKVPTAAQLTASLCAGRPLNAREGVVIGHVRVRNDTLPPAGASVVAEWVVHGAPDVKGDVERTTKRVAGKAAADGSFRLCGVPLSTVVMVAASTSNAAAPPTPTFSATRVVRSDLLMEPGVHATGTFAGKVLVDSVKTPIEGAEIYFPELTKLARSGADGSFRIAEVPAGEQHVIVRRVGYGPLDTKLTFRENATLDRQVFLTKATLLDSVVVSDKAADPLMRDFEENRHLGFGHFMDRSELAKLTSDTKVERVLAQWPGLALLQRPGHTWLVSTRKGPPLCLPNSPKSCFEGQGYYATRDPAQGIEIGCYAQIYIDGTLMNRGNPTPPFDLAAVFADQIEAVEWYAGPSETPRQYLDLNAVCGVLAIDTRRTP